VRYTAPGGCCQGAFAASNLDHDGGVDLGDFSAFANNFTAQVRYSGQLRGESEVASPALAPAGGRGK
jgi:hypothetical protein